MVSHRLVEPTGRRILAGLAAFLLAPGAAAFAEHVDVEPERGALWSVLIDDAGRWGDAIDVASMPDLEIRPENRLAVNAGDLSYRLGEQVGGTITLNPDLVDLDVDGMAIDADLEWDRYASDGGAWMKDAGLFGFASGGGPSPFTSGRFGRRGITAGATLVAATDDARVGLMDLQVDRDGVAGGRSLAIARASVDLDDRSTLGGIVTWGDPSSDEACMVYGADFSFHDSQFGGDRALAMNAWFLGSDVPDEATSRTAWGASIAYPNDRLSFGLGITVVDEAFNAPLGSVPQRGVREYVGNLRYRWRPEGLVSSIDTGVSGRLVTDIDDDEVRTGRLDVNVVTLETGTRERLTIGYELNRHVVTSAHTVSGARVEPGLYDYGLYNMSLTTSSARPIRGRMSVRGGDFYSGHLVETAVGVQWRPSRELAVDLEYAQNEVDLGVSAYSSHIARVRWNLFFSPACTWSNLVEYSDVSEDVRFDSRIRWVLEDGNEVSVGVNQRVGIDEDGFTPTEPQMTTQVGMSFTF